MMATATFYVNLANWRSPFEAESAEPNDRPRLPPTSLSEWPALPAAFK
jgi:hypothetical protein